jgi:hypothetical protein
MAFQVDSMLGCGNPVRPGDFQRMGAEDAEPKAAIRSADTGEWYASKDRGNGVAALTDSV